MVWRNCKSLFNVTLYRRSTDWKLKDYVLKNNLVCTALEMEVRRVCTQYAAERRPFLIPILKSFCICVHEGNEKGYDGVPWGNSLCARKLCDVIAVPWPLFGISVTLHSSRMLSLALIIRNVDVWTHILHHIFLAVLVNQWSVCFHKRPSSVRHSSFINHENKTRFNRVNLSREARLTSVKAEPVSMLAEALNFITNDFS